MVDLKFHHLGLAVKNPEPALCFLSSLGYEQTLPVHDELQEVNLVMCMSSTMPAIEVIFATSARSPLESILKQNDARVYHLCYETDSLETVLEELRAKGHNLYCVSPRKPAVLFTGRYVSFYYIKGFGLIEILEGG